MRVTRRVSVFASLFFVLQTFAAVAANAQPVYDLKVLLIGSSLSRGIKKPLRIMLESEGFTPFIKAAAPALADLQFHVTSPRTEKYINQTDWDVVFLQQTSLGLAEYGGGYQAVRDLYQKINGIGARTVLFQTWRERTVPLTSTQWDLLKGEPGGNIGYVPIAFELDIGVAPVGWAVRQTGMDIGDPPPWDLWKGGKGRHLSDIGNYLAACVVYSVVTGNSPRGVWAPYRFPSGAADLVQNVAEQMVITDAATWNLN